VEEMLNRVNMNTRLVTVVSGMLYIPYQVPVYKGTVSRLVTRGNMKTRLVSGMLYYIPYQVLVQYRYLKNPVLRIRDDLIQDPVKFRS
jgi:hypothetical protein